MNLRYLTAGLLGLIIVSCPLRAHCQLIAPFSAEHATLGYAGVGTRLQGGAYDVNPAVVEPRRSFVFGYYSLAEARLEGFELAATEAVLPLVLSVSGQYLRLKDPIDEEFATEFPELGDLRVSAAAAKASLAWHLNARIVVAADHWRGRRDDLGVVMRTHGTSAGVLLNLASATSVGASVAHGGGFPNSARMSTEAALGARHTFTVHRWSTRLSIGGSKSELGTRTLSSAVTVQPPFPIRLFVGAEQNTERVGSAVERWSVGGSVKIEGVELQISHRSSENSIGDELLVSIVVLGK